MEIPPRELETERLVLRAWRLEDAPALRAALDANDAHLRPWIPFMRREPRSLEGTREDVGRYIADFEAGRHFRYVIWAGEALAGEVMLLGRAGPEALEIGYWLDAGCCGRGYATEASRAMVGLVFGHFGVGRVVFRCDERNGASGAVPAKLGARVARVVTVEEGARLQVWVLEGPGELKSG